MFYAGIYLRLSREDGDQDISESILNQKAYLEKYCADHGFQMVRHYVDDGYSGTNFDRPGFAQMLEDIEGKKINMVITKDLSRLGRDYILTGHYLERYFPEKRVRYIAVNDGIDTFAASENNDMNAFRAVINDMYAKDISKKVRTALTTKKEKGEFIGAFAPYGYEKHPEDKNRLVVQQKTAPFVRLIFTLFLQGNNLKETARLLTEQKIPTPSQLQGSRRTSGAWSDVMVKRILTNQTYIGNLTQNRSRKINYKVKRKVSLPQSQWIVVKGTHEPIVERELFFRAAQKLKGRQGHILSGLVYCKDCGSRMTFLKSGPHTYLVCSGWKNGKTSCTSHSIREDFVLEQAEKLQRTGQEHLLIGKGKTVELEEWAGQKSGHEVSRPYDT